MPNRCLGRLGIILGLVDRQSSLLDQMRNPYDVELAECIQGEQHIYCEWSNSQIRERRGVFAFNLAEMHFAGGHLHLARLGKWGIEN